MSTIHIHPTATNPASLARLQERTGMVAVISGNHADLISDIEFANHPDQRDTWEDITNDDGPSAA